MTTQNQRSKSRRTKKSRKASLAADKARADRQDLKLQQLTEKRRIREIEQRKYAAEGTSFFAVETDVRKEVRDAGHLRLLEKLSGFGTGFEGNSRVCPKCGAQQHFKGNVDRTRTGASGRRGASTGSRTAGLCSRGCMAKKWHFHAARARGADQDASHRFVYQRDRMAIIAFADSRFQRMPQPLSRCPTSLLPVLSMVPLPMS